MSHKQPPERRLPDVSRRGFLKGAGATVAAGSLVRTADVAESSPSAETAADTQVHKAAARVPISFELNGRQTITKVRTGHTLLETLRDHLDMTGTKLVCDRGSCGACTVLLDGEPVNSCLTLAVDAHGKKVQTVEGLAQDGTLHPVQQAFVEEDAMQCGFCTPGMVMSCKALLDRNPKPSLEETKDALSGNICRCGTYVNIFRAVDNASKRMKGGRDGR